VFVLFQGPAISITGLSVVVGNNVRAGGGILINGTGSRVEGNTVAGTGVGFDVDGTGNLVIRNSASGNTTDYDIAAGNAHGPIVDVGGAGDIGAVTGADHPWANFRY